MELYVDDSRSWGDGDFGAAECYKEANIARKAFGYNSLKVFKSTRQPNGR